MPPSTPQEAKVWCTTHDCHVMDCSAKHDKEQRDGHFGIILQCRHLYETEENFLEPAGRRKITCVCGKKYLITRSHGELSSTPLT